MLYAPLHSLIIFLCLCILSVVYLKLADNFNIIDKPNHRSSHTVPTIRGGGMLFYLAILIFFLVSGFKYPYFFIGVSLIAIVSFADDIITLSSSLRLPFQFLAVALCFFEVGIIPSSGILILPFLVMGVGLINEYNFMDGVNGITGFYSIVNLLILLLINSKENLVDNKLLIYVIFSVVIFGFYNFRKKARMFAGDIGSITIAVLLCFVGSLFIFKLKSPVILLLISVYSVDAILTIIHRKLNGERLTEAHRKHIYQKLVHVLKMSHLKIAILYALIQGFINIGVFYSYKLSFMYQFTILILVTLILTLAYLVLFKFLEKKNVSLA